MSTSQLYEEEGYVVFRTVVQGALLERAADHIAWLIDNHPDIKPELLTTHNIVDDPFWIRLVSEPALLDIAEQFVGPNIALFGAHYFCKMPYEGKPVLWHQDGSYWPLEPMEVVTLWLAVDPSVPENGCLRVIPRSHRLSLQEMVSTKRDGNILGSEIDPKLVDDSVAVDVILNPGDVSVHHPNVIHGSAANTSPMRRCGMAIRYISAETRVLRPETPLYLLRGKAKPGINEYRPIPEYIASHF